MLYISKMNTYVSFNSLHSILLNLDNKINSNVSSVFQTFKAPLLKHAVPESFLEQQHWVADGRRSPKARKRGGSKHRPPPLVVRVEHPLVQHQRQNQRRNLVLVVAARQAFNEVRADGEYTTAVIRNEPTQPLSDFSEFSQPPTQFSRRRKRLLPVLLVIVDKRKYIVNFLPAHDFDKGQT